MSKSDISCVTNISQLSVNCKGNSKKEKEVNMMVNLVEEFLRKFDTSNNNNNNNINNNSPTKN
jgi:hypothetical protein